MRRSRLPGRQGLYDPMHEHDACGVGFVVNIKGERSHDHHRAGPADPREPHPSRRLRLRSADRRRRRHPHADARRVSAARSRASSTSRCRRAGEYGVGMVFLPPSASTSATSACELVREGRAEEGQRLLGWRDVPVDASKCWPARARRRCRRSARSSSPAAAPRRTPQCSSASCTSSASASSAWCASPGLRDSESFYMPSLSSRTHRLQGPAAARADSAVLPRPDRPDVRPARSRWCTSASAPTRSRPGTAPTRSATWRTTARSTRCAATSTGCTRASDVRVAAASATT